MKSTTRIVAAMPANACRMDDTGDLCETLGNGSTPEVRVQPVLCAVLISVTVAGPGWTMGIATSCGSVNALKVCGGTFVVAFISLGGSIANADDGEDKYRLVWLRGANASECPEQSLIERQVQLRLARNPFEPDASRIIHVLVSSEGGSWHVDLVVENSNRKVLGQRIVDVTADNCGEVATAVSLAIALAIDPSVALQANRPEATSAADVPAQPLQPALQPSAASSAFSVPQHPHETGAPAAAFLRAYRNPYQYELTLRATGTTGILPTFAGGTSVAGAFGRDGTRLMVALTYLPESTSDARFSFGFAAASGGVCGDITRQRLLATTVCGEFSLGAIHSVVHQLEPLNPGDRLTAAVGLGPKIGWRAWAPLFLEVGVSAWVGLVRPKFAIINADSTRTTVFQSQAVSGLGFVGVGVTAP